MFDKPLKLYLNMACILMPLPLKDLSGYPNMQQTDKKNWEDYFAALKTQDWETAKNSLQKIISVEGENPNTHLKLGDVYQRTGDAVNAVSSYHHAVWLMQSKGFFQKALALYKIILRLDPHNSEAISSSMALMMELETAKTPVPLPPVKEKPATGTVEEFATCLSEKTPASLNSELFSGMSEKEIQLILE